MQNIDQAIATADSLELELRALPQRRKQMSSEELDEKLGNLAIVAGNLADTLKEVRQKAEDLKEY